MTRLTYLGLILDCSIITISLPEEEIEKIFKVFSVTLTICQGTRIVFTDVQGLKTSRPLRVMITILLRN